MSFRVFAVIGVLLALGGCVAPPQLPVPLAATAVGGAAGKVGVALNIVEKADTYFPGADCLLCYGLASAANSTLTAYVVKQPIDDVVQFQADVVTALGKKQTSVVALPRTWKIDTYPKLSSTQPNAAVYDFSALKKTDGLDRLLVINVTSLGVERTYASYIPTSEPKAFVLGSAYMVNLTSNQYEWFEPIAVRRAADGKWDEPPNFPGLTNALVQAIESARTLILKPFAK
ncbi:MAG: hypothetical protein C4K60_02170 [Ideonella sp. MAG2]|nr:MAG: hypothetical protein C4K60_02170 [Ideonella sp. MAG2]